MKCRRKKKNRNNNNNNYCVIKSFSHCKLQAADGVPKGFSLSVGNHVGKRKAAASNGRMNNEQNRIWKEAVVDSSRQDAGTCTTNGRKTISTFDIPAYCAVAAATR
jgi:hypothetical protein